MVPNISHLQFLVLHLLLHDDHSGRFLRDRLSEEGNKQSHPAFYQMMARLEQDTLVMGWYESVVVDGQTIREKMYSLTSRGRKAHASVQEFYIPKLTSDRSPVRNEQ